ncbi:MAG TPA: helix-turn-helix domain-containing protein [Xanthomonadaceae bacterium]
MANFASLLKDEISRISRKEIRKEVLALRKASTVQRHAIATLKRQVQELQRSLSVVAKRTKPKAASEIAASGKPLRFVAKGLVSLRARLGLSAPELARLLSVSAQTIYNWEQKKTVPGKPQVAALAALRSTGKREVRTRLEELSE